MTAAQRYAAHPAGGADARHPSATATARRPEADLDDSPPDIMHRPELTR
jgi:hypothetical protein